ncbi:hypothetical protein AB0D59_43150 [Streptomyces sp. NPDC048417]|uniref:hypothetical protein n=1 Tax=Streptomyces sp. NPDC048417 TaxID=3155387 RepID=UPI00343EA5D1
MHPFDGVLDPTIDLVPLRGQVVLLLLVVARGLVQGVERLVEAVPLLAVALGVVAGLVRRLLGGGQDGGVLLVRPVGLLTQEVGSRLETVQDLLQPSDGSLGRLAELVRGITLPAVHTAQGLDVARLPSDGIGHGAESPAQLRHGIGVPGHRVGVQLDR